MEDTLVKLRLRNCKYAEINNRYSEFTRKGRSYDSYSNPRYIYDYFVFRCTALQWATAVSQLLFSYIYHIYMMSSNIIP